VANFENKSLEDTTLQVYAYVVKEGKPVGPRDVTRGLQLSSPSVAYRHLQKLEDIGLLVKNEYGEYIVKEKRGISGYVWIGRKLVPRLMLYSILFMSILVFEIIILIIHYSVEDNEFKIFFLLLTAITAIATAIFMTETIRIKRKKSPRLT
jgi:hypothetical protein